MSTTTLLQLRNRVRQRADIESDTVRHTDAQLNQYINDSHKKLYGELARFMLLKNEVQRFYDCDGSPSYSIEDDFFALYGVFEQLDETHRRLKRHNAGDRPFEGNAPTGTAYSYRMAVKEDENRIEFYPRPTSGTYVVAYVPVPATLSADTDTIDNVLGWDEYIILDAAIKVMEKDDLDYSQLAVSRRDIEMKIEDQATARDLLHSSTVRDVYGLRSGESYYEEGDYIRHGGRWWND